MHILRNTGKRIIFHVYNDLFGETSFSKDKNCENYHFIYKTIHLFMFETKKIYIFLWAYTFLEVWTHDRKICIIPKATAFKFWKKVVNIEIYEGLSKSS